MLSWFIINSIKLIDLAAAAIISANHFALAFVDLAVDSVAVSGFVDPLVD
ncbi:hypothetical protein [Acinetobacter sp. TSRC1-2]